MDFVSVGYYSFQEGVLDVFNNLFSLDLIEVIVNRVQLDLVGIRHVKHLIVKTNVLI
jgi:hypothetical protein